MTSIALPSNVQSAIKATKRRDALVAGFRKLWPSLMVFAGLGAAGTLIKDWPPALLSIIAGFVILLASILFVRALMDFRPIDDAQAGRRVEAAFGAGELGPLTSSNDRAVSGNPDLWDWHQAKLKAAAGKLTKAANPALTTQDGLRALALVMAVGICLWQPVAAARALSFDLSPLMGDGDLIVDAWAKPPEYTGLPIIRLSRDNSQVNVPAGSQIFARMDGARGAPNLQIGGKTIKMAREQGQAWTANGVMARSGRVSLNRFGSRAAWQVHVTPDLPPKLISEEAIKIDPKGRLEVSFRASDDYGVAGVALRIKALNTPVGLIGQDTFETPIELSGDAGEDGARKVFVNVSDHVLTGEAVSIEIIARDGLGQETASKPTRLTMPRVEWKSSLAAALQEQRLLILREARPYQARLPMFAKLTDPETGMPIKLDLNEPLLGAPEGIKRAAAMLDATFTSLKQAGMSETGLMAFQFARERLALARNVEDAHDVAPLLWALATGAESSDQTPAQQKMMAARQALEDALKNGASDEQIAQLSQELREAIGERLDELAQQGQGEGQGDPNGEGRNSVSGSDIDDMLRQMEQSGSNGARQEALDQLDKLSELMDNLQAGGEGQSESGRGGQAGSGPLDEAMRQQRDLSDDTNARNQQNEGAPAPDLAQRQEDLADQISPKGDNQTPPQGPGAQAQAGRAQAGQAMREAAEALRRGDLNGAARAQAQAEQALQQGAQAMAGNGDQGDQDPLGRALPRRDDGKGTKVPDQVEKRRARDVREELRRRQGDNDRDAQERGYLDRLLKDR